MTTKFTQEQIDLLKFYVYVYIDPRNNEMFYIGKGKNNRVFAHLNDKIDSPKKNRIEEIRQSNNEPKIEILAHGLTDENTALKVEAAIIDLIGLENLTNKVKGHESSLFGRIGLEELLQRYSNEKAVITEPSILIKINKLFRYGVSTQELYDYTRGCWKVGKNSREQVKLAFSIYDQIIQEVYEVAHWFKGGTTYMGDRTSERNDRWEFVGKPAKEEIRKKYINKSVSAYYQKGNQNPIKYLNII